MTAEGPAVPPSEQRPVTRETLAENERKQAEYAAKRRAWTARQLRHPTSPEPEPPPAQATDRLTGSAKPQRGRGSIIHDKRQARLDL